MTDIDVMALSTMVVRQLPYFSLIVPFWLIWAFAGFRGMLEIWPAILVTGVSFAVPQYLVSNHHGPYLVDVIAALVSMACPTGFLRVWQLLQIWTSTALSGRAAETERATAGTARTAAAGAAARAPASASAGEAPGEGLPLPDASGAVRFEGARGRLGCLGSSSPSSSSCGACRT